MPEIIAVRIEEGPGAVTPMGYEDTAYAFRALGALIQDGVAICVNSVSIHDNYETGHLEVWIWGWSKLTDYLLSNTPDIIVDAMEDTGEHEFDERSEGITFIENLRKVIDEWKPFVTKKDELNLIVQL